MTIYRDPLGQPAPYATISVTGDTYGIGGHWYMHSASDAPDRRWDRDVSIETICAELSGWDWDCVITYPHIGRPPVARATHRTTRAAIDSSCVSNGYIRYGDLPPRGKSYNYRDNAYEAGVSCYPAEYDDNGLLIRVDIPAEAHSMQCYQDIKDRPAYRLYGDLIGLGSDGEPCLSVTAIEAINV